MVSQITFHTPWESKAFPKVPEILRDCVLPVMVGFPQSGRLSGHFLLLCLLHPTELNRSEDHRPPPALRSLEHPELQASDRDAAYRGGTKECWCTPALKAACCPPHPVLYLQAVPAHLSHFSFLLFCRLSKEAPKLYCLLISLLVPISKSL